MPYSFMWLYLIKCGVHIQSYVDQTQKYFWVFLVVFFFWKVFLFRKISENPKFVQFCFGDSFAGQASRELTQKLSWLFGECVP